MVVAPIIFFIKKCPSTRRSPRLPALYKAPQVLPVYSPPPSTISFFVNKFIKKKRCPYLCLCLGGGPKRSPPGRVDAGVCPSTGGPHWEDAEADAGSCGEVWAEGRQPRTPVDKHGCVAGRPSFPQA